MPDDATETHTLPDDIASPEECVDRARALVPALRARQLEAEEARAVPQESVNEMRDAGLYRILQPKRFGGYEHGLDDYVDVAIEIASGCGSTGWNYANSSTCQWLIGLWPLAAQEEIWGEDRRATAGASFDPSGVAVPADGGYRLTGKWMYCAGIDSVEWMILATRVAPAVDAEPTDQGYVLVRTDDCEIDDDWFVSGLVGTGARNAACTDLFVPEHRFLRLEDASSGSPPGAEANPGPLFRIPVFAALSVGPCAAILGMARGAYDSYLATTGKRITRGAAMSRPAAMAEIPSIQLRVGEAAGCIDAARRLVDRDCRDIMATVAAGQALSVEQRARNKGDLGLAARLARRAVDRMFESGGGGGISDDNPVQRFWRDVHAGARHVGMNRDAAGALYGRVSLGLPPGPAQF